MDSHQMAQLRNCTYVMANAIGGLIEALGMYSKNIYRDRRGETIAYDDEHFQKLMEERGLHHNAIITELNR